MRFKCSMCEHIFQSTAAPMACPSCKGTGKPRYGLPKKRLTHAQKRQIAKLDPELVKAFREAQARSPEGGRVQVKIVPPDLEKPDGT